MTDGVISGTGNSRYLKSVANVMTLYPSHEALMEALAAGTFPIDLNGINPAGWETVGDKLGKSTLLTDALCTALGLATTATPTQAMDKLRQLVNTAQAGVNNGPKMTVVSYAGTGVAPTESAPKSITFPAPPKLLFMVNAYGAVIAGNSSGARNTQYYSAIAYPQLLTTEWNIYGCLPFSETFAASSNYYLPMKKSSDGKTIYWYTTHGSASGAYNMDSRTYYCVAFY